LLQQALYAKLQPNMSSSHRQNRKSNLLQSKQLSTTKEAQLTVYSQATISDSAHTLEKSKSPVFTKKTISMGPSSIKVKSVKH
jgi:hypothetical protein